MAAEVYELGVAMVGWERVGGVVIVRRPKVALVADRVAATGEAAGNRDLAVAFERQGGYGYGWAVRGRVRARSDAGGYEGDKVVW